MKAWPRHRANSLLTNLYLVVHGVDDAVARNDFDQRGFVENPRPLGNGEGQLVGQLVLRLENHAALYICDLEWPLLSPNGSQRDFFRPRALHAKTDVFVLGV